MLTLDEAENIVALSDEYKSLRRGKSARAVGVRKDLIDILSERNNLEHKFAAMTTDRDSLIAQLSRQMSVNQHLIQENATLRSRLSDTQSTTPTIGDSIRAIWKRHDGNVTGATLEVMDYMREHGNRITLYDAQRLLRIHVPELTSAEELAE